MTMQNWTGEYLGEQLRGRHAVQEVAAKVSERVEDFVVRFPKHRLYEIAPRAPYAKTKPGSLVVLVDYKLDAIDKSEEPETVECVKCKLVRDPDETWTDGSQYWLHPKWLKRVDEEEYGVEISS